MLTSRTLRFVLSGLALGTAGLMTWGGETFKPGKLSKEEQAALQPGLTLRFFATDAIDKALDSRRVRLAALHVPAGSAPSPFLDPGPFLAKLSGYIKTPIKSEYSFRLASHGSATLLINNKEILKSENGTKETPEPIQLAKGYNRIEVVYSSPANGDATVRVYWTGEGFATEPLPPDMLSSRDDEADIVRGQGRREGRFLYATLGCARCHELPANLKEKEVAMPEMAQRAPSLQAAGHRFGRAWLAQWIAEPRALRPQARMPHLLHGNGALQDAADLAEYLAGLRDGPAPVSVEPTAELVAQGEKHFDKLGCISCHHLDDPKNDDTLGRLSLFFVKSKFQPGALSAFLRAPHKHYPWIRMPDFRLDAKEADALEVFLFDRAKGNVTPVAPAVAASAERGAKRFAQLGCANCHATMPGDAPAPKLRPNPPVQGLAAGCLDAAHKLAPDFGLKPPQVKALQSFLKADGPSLRRETLAEFSLRQVKELQCQACHRRDGQNSRWNQILEDEGLMPEFLPSLTWVGEKLIPAWTAKQLAGEHDHRARPWLKARMPAFPARAAALALGLSHEHGFAADEDDRPAPDPKLAALGEKLIEMQGGFNCVMCHAVGKRPSVAPFEAPGINLLDAAVRLRHSYYPRWMIDPPHVDITTRMPKFSLDGKTTPLREVLDGDAFRQYEAVWHFIQTLPGKGTPGNK